MDRLKTQGGVPPELMEQAKQAMLAENMDFSEQQEPSARCGAGMPSVGGFIEQHFDFAQATPDLEYLHKQLKSALKGRDSGRKNSSQARVDGLRAQIKKKLKLDKIAKKDALSMATDLEVYNDPRGGSDSDYAEEGDTQDFQTCQRADGSYYGSRGRCIKGSEATLPDRKGAGKKKSEGGGAGGGDNSTASGLANDLIDDYDLKGKAAASVKKDMQAAASLAIAGKPGEAIDAIDRAMDKAGADMETRERALEEVGALSKGTKITKDMTVTNLALQDDFKAMDSEMKAEIRSAARDYKKGNLEYDELQERLDEASSSSLAPVKMGVMKNGGGEYETEIENLQLERWTDAVVNAADGAGTSNGIGWALGQFD